MTVKKMTAGLYPLDSKMPNLAMMQISSYVRSLGMEPKMFQPGELNFVSIVFTKSREAAEKLLTMPNVVIGGTGVDVKGCLPPEIASMPYDYSIYPECDYSIGFTSRGCDGSCKFCVVPEKEGHTRSVATIADIHRPGTKMIVLLDNDFLGNPNYPERLAEIRDMKLKVNFNQAISARKINDFNAHLISQVRTTNITQTTNSLHLAFDNPEYEPFIRNAVDCLKRAGVRPARLVFYVLVGCDTTFEEDMYRFKVIRDLGCHPYIMKYAPLNAEEQDRVNQRYSARDRARSSCFARWINWRIYKSEPNFEKYDAWMKWQSKHDQDQMVLGL